MGVSAEDDVGAVGDERVQHPLVGRVRQGDADGVGACAIVVPADVLAQVVQCAGEAVQAVPAPMGVVHAEQFEP